MSSHELTDALFDVDAKMQEQTLSLQCKTSRYSLEVSPVSPDELRAKMS